MIWHRRQSQICIWQLSAVLCLPSPWMSVTPSHNVEPLTYVNCRTQLQFLKSLYLFRKVPYILQAAWVIVINMLNALLQLTIQRQNSVCFIRLMLGMERVPHWLVKLVQPFRWRNCLVNPAQRYAVKHNLLMIRTWSPKTHKPFWFQYDFNNIKITLTRIQRNSL